MAAGWPFTLCLVATFEHDPDALPTPSFDISTLEFSFYRYRSPIHTMNDQIGPAVVRNSVRFAIGPGDEKVSLLPFPDD